MPLGDGMVKAVERAHTIGATAIQVFGDNPTAWKRRSALPDELPRFRERLDTYDIAPLAVHASYLVNPAGSDPEFFERSCAVLRSELEVAAAYGARYLNVHIGSHLGAGAEAGAERVAEAVARALGRERHEEGAPVLVLENSSGGGNGLGSTAEELSLVLDAIERRGVDRAGVALCIDTAHLWGAGIDLRDVAATDAFLEELDRRAGIGRVVMSHLNDSRSELGSRSDRHEHVGAGQIGEAGLRHVVTHPRLEHVAFIVETPGMDEGYDAINVARVHDLVAGRPLATLPPEAFTIRGSRSRRAAPAERRAAREAARTS